MGDEITVLVAEDEVLVRLYAVEALADAGFVVKEAVDAADALDFLKSGGVDVLFTDINMPGKMDGLELARYVHDAWPKVALLIASGNVTPVGTQLPPGSRFLPKPYDIGKVVDQVRKLAAAMNGAERDACRTSPGAAPARFSGTIVVLGSYCKASQSRPGSAKLSTPSLTGTKLA